MKPYQVLLFIACVMACLAALCIVLPGRVAWGEKELRWPTLAEVMGNADRFADEVQNTDLITIADSIDEPMDTIVAVDTIVPKAPKVVIPQVRVDSTSDSRVFLNAFYASLSESSTHTIRVLHYGDSQIEEDRMTQQIREAPELCGSIPGVHAGHQLHWRVQA